MGNFRRHGKSREIKNILTAANPHVRIPELNVQNDKHSLRTMGRIRLTGKERKEKFMTLSLMKSGDSAIIKKITGKDEVRKFLASIGFVEGEEVTVVSEIAGDMVLNIKNTRVALSRSMANRIIV